MNILFIINSFGVGGAEKQVASLAREHLNRGNNVLLVRLKNEPSELLEGTCFTNSISLKMDTFKGLLASVSKLNKIILDFKPDVVHSHLPHSIVFSRIAKLFNKSDYKLICTAHNYNIRTKLFGLLYKWTDYLSDFNTNVSQSAVDRYIKEGFFSKAKSCYVPNGFLITSKEKLSSYSREQVFSELGFSDRDFICCAIGRLDAQKNYSMLLKSFKKVVCSDSSFKLIIMGGGPDKANLISEMKNLGLQDNVFFLGIVNDVYKYLSISDLYLMTSVFEGMPLAICEAMIAKKPIVVTNFVGVHEFVKNYYPIIEQNDSTGFANAILEAKNLDFFEVAEKARTDIIKYYSIESVVDKWIDIYEL